MITQYTQTTADATVSTNHTRKRYVYSDGDVSRRTEFNLKGNRPMRARKRSTFKIILLLVGVSVLIVFYIWNKICVNQLVVEVNDLRNQHQKIQNANEFLRAEVSKKSSLERIVGLATEQLGLVVPKEQPVWFQINENNYESYKNKK